MWSLGWLVVCLAVMALAYRVATCLRLAKQQRVRRDACATWLAVELRRSVELRSHADGLGGQCYPEPVETRTLVLVCCGLPLWTRCESIGLPAGSEARFDQLTVDDFDRHFTPAFSSASTQGTPIRAIRLLMPA